ELIPEAQLSSRNYFCAGRSCPGMVSGDWGERSLSASFALLVTLCRVAHLERQDRFHHHLAIAEIN
ncbi:MAG: hypothetical protein VXY89_04665, partial [SAR324 cluster bacterium]|nr:hypothetical protein [SAR324 cluster bacterium]